MGQFIFLQQEDEGMLLTDDLIGCVIAERVCICNTCGKDDCIYRGSLRGEI